MHRATHVAPAGSWPRDGAIDVVVLDFDARHRRRLVLTGERGTKLLLDLPEASVLRDGDGLVLADGAVVAVRAAPERLAEIRCGSAQALARIAWHLGNRHLPTQIAGDALRIREDQVIIDMARRLGAEVQVIEAPFDPEAGAYAHAHGHTHG